MKSPYERGLMALRDVGVIRASILDDRFFSLIRAGLVTMKAVPGRHTHFDLRLNREGHRMVAKLEIANAQASRA